jgi:hypothetical protein
VAGLLEHGLNPPPAMSETAAPAMEQNAVPESQTAPPIEQA